MSKITNSKQNCCKNNKENGLKSGIIYGLLPHSFCIGFILASIIGVTAATSFFRRLLLVPEFFQILVALSLIFATISAIIYLKKGNLLTKKGIVGKWKYLTILYTMTVGINLLMFLVVLPVIASRNWGGRNQGILAVQGQSQTINLQVNIPCAGHAPLIMDELRKIIGVSQVNFKFPNLFEVSYDNGLATNEEILSLEVFKTYPAKMI